MPSAEFDALLAAKRANPYREDKTVAELRAESDAAADSAVLPPGTVLSPVDLDGVAGEWIDVGSPAGDEVFLFIHGGGYYRGSIAATRVAAAYIGQATGARCLSVSYRLAPEHPFPAAIEDVHTSYRWLLGSGFSPANTVVGGISAGGGLTLALLLAARDAGEPLPAGAVPMSPWTDLLQTGESFTTRAAADPVISKAYLDRMAAYYLNGADARNPLASPLYGELAGLPPMLIQVGDAETMLSDSLAFAERAERAGVAVELDVHQHMIHGWQGSAHQVPEARVAIARIGEFFRRCVS